jgi:hypothetical protein
MEKKSIDIIDMTDLWYTWKIKPINFVGHTPVDSLLEYLLRPPGILAE